MTRSLVVQLSWFPAAWLHVVPVLVPALGNKVEVDLLPPFLLWLHTQGAWRAFLGAVPILAWVDVAFTGIYFPSSHQSGCRGCTLEPWYFGFPNQQQWMQDSKIRRRIMAETRETKESQMEKVCASWVNDQVNQCAVSEEWWYLSLALINLVFIWSLDFEWFDYGLTVETVSKICYLSKVYNFVEESVTFWS